MEPRIPSLSPVNSRQHSPSPTPAAGPSHLPLPPHPYASISVGSTPTPTPSLPRIPSPACLSSPPSTLLTRPLRHFRGIIVEEMSNVRGTDEHPNWGYLNIPGELVNVFVEAMPNNLIKDTKKVGNWYYAQEFMSLGIEMSKMGWDVRFLRWVGFRDALCSARGEIWDLLKGADVIVGGADLSGDYMSPSARYQFTSTSLEQYIDGASLLARNTIIWPDPSDLIVAGQKVHQTKRFADLNNNSSLTAPMTYTLKSTDDLPNSSLAVIKRGYSKSSCHVYFNKSQHGISPKSLIEPAMEETEKNWKGFPQCLVPQWFIQPLMKTMIELGEVKLFFVDLEYLYGVITAPAGGKLTVERYCGNIPLSNVTIGTHQDAEMARKALYINPFEKEVPRQLRKIGQMQLESYAKKMLLEVIQLEERSKGLRRSGLRFMARMDIAIIRNDSTGELSYWLNDIERGHCTNMFSKVDWDGYLQWAPSMIWMWERSR